MCSASSVAALPQSMHARLRSILRACIAMAALLLLCLPGLRAQAPASGVQMVDITASTKIHFDHLSSPQKKYIVESMSGGVALIDYDRDGWPDIYFTNAPDVDMQLAGKKARGALYRNNHDGTFTDVTEKAGVGTPCWAMGATVGDYNNDGWPDLLVTCFGGVVLYRNNGDGTFTDVARQAGVSDPQKFFGLTAVWSDFNDDGHLDLLVANDGEQNYLYRNNGNGTFTDVAYQSGIAVSQDGNEQANMGIALGDIAHSGRFAVAITHFSEEYAELYRNDGGMNFTDVAYAAGIARSTQHDVGWGDAFLDVDNDGWPDFLMVNGHVYPQVDSADVGTTYREPKLLFLNQHNGTFRDVSKAAGSALQVPQVSRGMAVGDLFNDGHVEAVVENLEGGPMILRPVLKPEDAAHAHWIGFELAGTPANRLALNARVRVTAGDLVQVDEVRSGGSYLSQNDLRLHFGLGAHAAADKVEILWPGGKAETLQHLAADRIYAVLQGHGVVPHDEIRPTAPATK